MRKGKRFPKQRGTWMREATQCRAWTQKATAKWKAMRRKMKLLTLSQRRRAATPRG